MNAPTPTDETPTPVDPIAADQRIQSAEGFVHQQDVGIGGHGAGKPYALLHAT